MDTKGLTPSLLPISTPVHSGSKSTTVPTDPEDHRRDELCLQLAENLHDLGATEFSRELNAGDAKFLIRVIRY